nr:MarR family transcriptional regulator [Brucella intermedia]
MIHNVDHTSKCREALSQLLWVTTLMSADMRRGLADYGLTEVRAHVLWELGTSERLTQRELAAALQVTPRNVTTLIDALESTGFVERTEHPSDRRAVIVVLTNKGQHAVSKLRLEMTNLAESLFGRVPEDDLRAFRQMLQELGAKLTKLSEREVAEKNRSAT